MIELQMRSTNLDFWILSKNQSVVSVSPKFQTMFEYQLSVIGAPYDIESLLDNESNCSDSDNDCELKRSTRQTRGFFSRFQRYSGVSIKKIILGELFKA